MKRWHLVLGLIFVAGLIAISGWAQSDVPLPDNFPPIQTRVMGETGEGYIYLSNFSRRRPDNVSEEEWITYSSYLMVLGNDGVPVFFQPIRRRASNFYSLPDGTLIYHAFMDEGRAGGAGTDGPYRQLDHDGDFLRAYRMQGHTTSLHEFVLLENGNVMMFTYDERVMDMTEYDGHPEAIVMNVVIQELDPENNIVWEWSGWDHFQLQDTVRKSQYDSEPPDPVDYVHPNGLAIMPDGDVLLSSKHLDEITRIDKETGEIVWRLGGINNPNKDFAFINDPFHGFSAQHSPVVLENGNLLLFDNGTARDPDISRAVEYAIDEEARTATLVWSYENGQYARGMGSVQRLENGNTVIGWGSSQGVAVSEVTPDGEVVFELTLPETQISYRAFRLPY